MRISGEMEHPPTSLPATPEPQIASHQRLGADISRDRAYPSFSRVPPSLASLSPAPSLSVEQTEMVRTTCR